MNTTDAGETTPCYLWRCNGIAFDETRMELRIDGTLVGMEPRPLQVLALLLHHAGEVVTKQELLEEVWAGRPTVDHVLATAIGKLRRAFGPELESLIATVPRMGYRFTGTVERIAIGKRMRSRLSLKPGQTVPGREHFVLGQQLGRTHGNEVWLARHDKTRATRVYKFGFDADHLSALKREATLARVLRQSLGERDDFVRVIDWNFSIEPYYLEEEYGGVDLAEWASQEPDLSQWALPQRIGFFLGIADAIAAAHSVGVLHKDLKPANVLVQRNGNGQWQTRLTDFGSGRLLQPERLDALGITALGLTQPGISSDPSGGTLLYLAPEVIGGLTPTVQSDVYALGILLYQVALGDLRKPLTTGWEHDIADPLLREDIAHATDGAPQRRLASAAELAERLRQLPQRHAERERLATMQHNALATRRALERAHARRPWIALAGILLALGFGASAWLYLLADGARLRAEHEVARSQAIQRFLRDDLIGAADPTTADFKGNPTITELLRHAEDTLAGRFRNDPDVRGSLYEALARTYDGLGRYEDALSVYRGASRSYATAFGATAAATLRMRYGEARMLANLGRFDDANQLVDDTSNQAGALATSDPEVALHAALANGTLHRMRFEIEPMLRDYTTADTLQRQTYPDDAQLAYSIRSQLVQAHLRHGDVDAAESTARAMLADPLLSETRIGKAAFASSRVELARVIRRRDRTDDALAEAEPAVATLKDVLGATHPRTLDAISVLSSLYSDLDRCEPARVTAQEVVDGSLATRGEIDQQTLIAIGNLGFVEYYCDDLKHSLEHLLHAEKGLVEHYGTDNAAAQTFRYRIATALTDAGRYDEALARLDTLSADALKASFARPDTANQLDLLRGRIYALYNRHEEGMKILRDLRDRIAAAGDDEDAVQHLDAMLAEYEKR